MDGTSYIDIQGGRNLFHLFMLAAELGLIAVALSLIIPKITSNRNFPIAMPYCLGLFAFGMAGMIFMELLPGFLMLLAAGMALLAGYVAVNFWQNKQAFERKEDK